MSGSGVVGMPFEDYGNAPETFIDSQAIPAWEQLEGGMFRLFVCKTWQGRLVLDHTDVMTKTTMIAIAKRFLEIAGAVDQVPTWAADMSLKLMS